MIPNLNTKSRIKTVKKVRNATQVVKSDLCCSRMGPRTLCGWCLSLVSESGPLAGMPRAPKAISVTVWTNTLARWY